MTREELIIEVMAKGILEGAWGQTVPWDDATERQRDEAMEHALEALRALRTVGFAIVPKEPTDEMVTAGELAMIHTPREMEELCAAEVYQAMIVQYTAYRGGE